MDGLNNTHNSRDRFCLIFFSYVPRFPIAICFLLSQLYNSFVLIVFYFYYIVSVVYSYSAVAKKNLGYVDKIMYCCSSLLNISFRVEEIEIINSNKCTGRKKMFIHNKCAYRIVTFKYFDE